MAFLLVVYDRVAALARVHVDRAIAHGKAILALSGGVERSADHWLAGVSWLHAPADLQAPSGSQSERAFETEILLNRTAENHIEFELPGLKWNAGSRPLVQVQECKAFTAHQWLHLLIIAAGETNETD